MFESVRVVFRGAGDIASGCAWRLRRAGFPVVMIELPQPLSVRAAVSFSSAVRYSMVVIQGVYAILCHTVAEVEATLAGGMIAVLVDPTGSTIPALRPEVLIDARMAKVNLDTQITDAPFVIGLGPGFEVGTDCHAVIETNRGHDLGRVLWAGGAEPDTGAPASIGGKDLERVLRAPANGIFFARAVGPGCLVRKGNILATIGEVEIRAPFDGVVRGLIDDDTPVTVGMKVGDLDPRVRQRHCFTISDKSLSVGGGVLEAILSSGMVHRLTRRSVTEGDTTIQ